MEGSKVTVPTASMLSKKKYYKIAKLAEELFGGEEKVSTIMNGIGKIMRFDPVKSYPVENSKKTQERHKKRTEELNITVYEYTNGRAYYLKNKEKLNKRRAENARKNALLRRMDELRLKE